MKTFSIDIEAVESAAYAMGMANIRAKITLTESAAADGFSELHMSEKSLRLIHQALNKIVTNVDTMGAVSVTSFPALQASGPAET